MELLKLQQAHRKLLCMSAIKLMSYLVTFIFPVYISVRFPLWGKIYGGLCFWFMIAGIMLFVDPAEGLAWVGLILWLFVGWPVGILYCTITSLGISLGIYFLQRIFR